jgi:8-oxo-dGTP diphosphatase
LNVPRGLWALGKEIARHLLRRPVIGIAAAARTQDGRWLLVRRADTGQWALPGGTLEWGETLQSAICRELAEEAGVDRVELGELCGIYSAPERDLRFHAVTVLVSAVVGEPSRPPSNPLEIREARLFQAHELPGELAHGMTQMLDDARAGTKRWE